MKKCALQQNAIILSKEIEKSSKLEVMKNETYGEKSYITEMNMHNAQINLQLRSRMVLCKMNYLNHPQYKAELWKCDLCQTCIDR